MSRVWRWVLPCYLFTVPMTLIGFVLGHVFYKAHSWAWFDGVLTAVAGTSEDGSTRIWGKPNAQTLGWIVFYDSETMRGLPDIRVHEHAHVGQAFACSLLGVAGGAVPMVMGWSPWPALILGGFAGGLGFAILYGSLFLLLLLYYRTGWYDAYRANPFEVQAYNLQDRYLEGSNPRPWGT